MLLETQAFENGDVSSKATIRTMRAGMQTDATDFDQTVSDQAVSNDAAARAYAWSLLGATLTRPVDQRVLDILLALPDTRDDDSPMGLSWYALKMAAANVGDINSANLVEEYNDLFIGVGRGELVPYGSWYLSGFLMDQPLADLRADLDRLGFERNPEVKEPEDHAGALAETMAMVIGAADITPRAELTFFNRHIEPWMQRFFQDLAAAKSAKFYRAIGQFGAQFVETEREYLSL